MDNRTNPGPIPFHMFVDEAVSLYTGPQKRPKTLSKVCQVLQELAPFCSSTIDLNPVTIARWLAAYQHKRVGATHFNLLATLSALCSYGAYRGYLQDPFAFKPPRDWIPDDELVTEPFRKHRSAEEIGRVIAQADAEAATGGWHELRLRTFVYFLAYTGAHDAEIRGLRREDIDRSSQMITIRSHRRRRLKTGARVNRIGMADELARVYDDWEPHIGVDRQGEPCPYVLPGWTRIGPWNGGPPGYRPLDRVKQLGERAGVKKLTIIAFRHTFGTQAGLWDMNEIELQEILRHARSSTQRHYRHHNAELHHRAAAKVHFPRPTTALLGQGGDTAPSPGA